VSKKVMTEKMETPNLVVVDLNNPKHQHALIKLMNDYMEDEMGMGKPMPDGLGTKLIIGLKKHWAYLGFFAVAGGEFAALANCNVNFSTWQTKPLINIHDFIVVSNFRKMGIGQFLLKEIEKYARKEGYCRLNLEVRHDNYKAQKLYKKVGFTECQPPNYFWEKRW
jgi:ribosomal protein S18 acetylase RimI-like enzyme